MAEEMVRASGGFSRANMAQARAEGKAEGVAETRVGTAQLSDVLIGKTFTNNTAVGVTGTMPNNGGNDIILGASGVTAVIPRGYYNGNGSIDATAVYNAGRTAGYSQGHADWQNTVGSTAQDVWASGERVTSYSATYTASKAGILIIFVSAARFSSSNTEPTLSGMQIRGARRALSATFYRNEDKPSSAPERAFANSGMWVVEVVAGATVSWSLLIANAASVDYNHTLIAM